ncbi:hypothetical protein DKX38_015674 [Salix brachista]|uniref:Protein DETOXIFICATION n=1 Tax=Salix brachista TaxID=2182728 RepID=A0A5N5L7U2_9ROSI|nr:hypothetical protein DKX38_015674 [Salix brachista]
METGAEKSSLESLLILNQEKSHGVDGEVSQRGCFCRDDFIGEAKKQLCLSGPLIAVSLLQYCLQIISIMFVGHLGELALSSASMACSFASVTGFSVLAPLGNGPGPLRGLRKALNSTLEIVGLYIHNI